MKSLILIPFLFLAYSSSAQLSISAGMQRLKQGAVTDVGFLKPSKTQLYLNDYYCFNVDYKLNRVRFILETSFLPASAIVNEINGFVGESWHWNAKATQRYSELSMDYVGFSPGINVLVLDIKDHPSDWKGTLELGMYYQMDWLQNYEEWNHYQEVNYYNLGFPLEVYNDEFVTLEANEKYSQLGLEMSSRVGYKNYFLGVHARFSTQFKTHRTEMVSGNWERDQHSAFNYSLGLRLGYTFARTKAKSVVEQ